MPGLRYALQAAAAAPTGEAAARCDALENCEVQSAGLLGLGHVGTLSPGSRWLCLRAGVAHVVALVR